MEKFLVRHNSTGNLNSKRPAENIDTQWRQAKRVAAAKNQDRFDDSRELPTHNQFTSLPIDDEIPESNLNTESTAYSTKRPRNIPPIILSIQQNWTHETIKNLISKYSKNFHLQYRGNNKVAVVCYSSNDHQTLKDGLLKDDAKFITYTRKDEKCHKVVIKGLPSYVEHDLPSELERIGFQDVTVIALKTRNTNSSTCPPFLVSLPSGANINKFRQIKYLFNCVVTMERFKPNVSSGTQCFRCQNFGHASRNCNMPARCVKCTEHHPTHECPKKDRTQSAKCCNCNQDHPANYRQCSARLEYIKRISDSKTKVTNILPPNRFQIKSVPLKQAWMQSSHESSIKPQMPADVPLSSTVPAKSDNTLDEILEILTIIKNIKSQFMTCTSLTDKIILIIKHLGHYV